MIIQDIIYKDFKKLCSNDDSLEGPEKEYIKSLIDVIDTENKNELN